MKIVHLPVSYDPNKLIWSAFVIYNHYCYHSRGSGKFRELKTNFIIRNKK